MLAYDDSRFVEARARQENEEAYADDCVYFLRHENPEKLLAAVRFTTEEFRKAAERHGLKVNFGVAKTEALVVLRRVGRNKHMGSMCTPSGAMGPEVSRREDRTREACLAVAGRFFAAANFSLKCKRSVAATLLETRLLYSSETWPPLPMGHAKCLESVQIRWIRKADVTVVKAVTKLMPKFVRSFSIATVESKIRHRSLGFLAQLSNASCTFAGRGHATPMDQGSCGGFGGCASSRRWQ